MKYLYYPGCCQKGTSRAYEESLFAVFSKLNIELEELDDWNCCGTTTVIAVNKVLSLTLAARNLAIAEPAGLPLMTPCPSCWLSLTKVNKVFKDGDPLVEKVRESLAAGGLTYNGTTPVRHLLEFLVNEIGVERIRGSVDAPLAGLRVAPYYGCQVVRPYAEQDDLYEPRNLERIIETVGAEAATFELKTACCGGSMMAARRDIGQKMSKKILRTITEARADLAVTPCPLCQLNLELAQYGHNKLPWQEVEMPILNITQLMGLAFGVSLKELAFCRSVVPGVERRVLNTQKQLDQVIGG